MGPGAAFAHLGEALIARGEGRITDASDEARQALALFEAQGVIAGAAWALRLLGTCAELEGDSKGAGATLKRALELAVLVGEPGLTAAALEARAAALARLGRADAGARLLGTAARERARTHRPPLPLDADDLRRAEAALRGQIGDERFEKVFEEAFGDRRPVLDIVRSD